MKDKNFRLNLFVFVAASIAIVAGVLIAVLSRNNRLIALGWALIMLGACFLTLWLIRVLALRSVEREKREEERKVLAYKQAKEKALDDARRSFENKIDCPEINTVRIVGEGIEFFAEGRYVCKNDFKNIRGNHFAFEISSTKLKAKPENYDDVCDFEGNGILIEAGYFEGTALSDDENDNGILLPDTLENSIDKTVTLKEDAGYHLYVWTADGDEIDYGFLKILKCENDTLTVCFSLNVPAGLCDTVEGVVELKRDTDEENSDIYSLVKRIKRKRFNLIALSDGEVQSIKGAAPFLPESYIAFLKEVGFADLDWIDVGRNEKTPNNLNDDEVGYLNDIAKSYDNVDPADFYFIAVDSSDTYYAFSRDPKDKKVYTFSNDASSLATYETFEEFLTEILDAE